MLQRNTAEQICELVNNREDEGYDINIIDRRTSRIVRVLRANEQLDTERYVYQIARLEIVKNAAEPGGGYVESGDYALNFTLVRYLLTLVAKAKRARKAVFVAEATEGNETGYDVDVRSNGAIEVGCQQFTAEEVAFVAANLPKK